MKILVLCDIDGVIIPLDHCNDLLRIKNTFYDVTPKYEQFLKIMHKHNCTIMWFSYWEEESQILNDYFNENFDFMKLEINGIEANKESVLQHRINSLLRSYSAIICLDDELEAISCGKSFKLIRVDGSKGVSDANLLELENFLTSLSI